MPTNQEEPRKNDEPKAVSAAQVLEAIEPGTSIFLGTGAAEPRALIKAILDEEIPGARDLELVQVASFGDAISLEALESQRYRLKTFFSGWAAGEAIRAGRVDLIPARYSHIPRAIRSGQIPIEVAFVQLTPPNDEGYCSLGFGADVARAAIDTARLVVGELVSEAPFTLGDTLVHVSELDMVVESTEHPPFFPRFDPSSIYDSIARNVAAEIEDGACLSFSIGPLFEALGRHLCGRKDLGVHSPFFTDPLMDLVRCGAVTNRKKATFRGRSVATYVAGTAELARWLDRNPLLELQPLDKVFDPREIGRNDQMVTILPARKADLTGRIALHESGVHITTSPAEAIDFFNGAELSRGGRSIVAMPSRSKAGEPNIVLSIEGMQNQFTFRESINTIVTEYGAAYLAARSVRERAQALIEVAHPDDRKALLEEARAARLVYKDQIFIESSAHIYPSEAESEADFGDLEVHFRAILPSDEEQMRRLFYRFSDKSVYYRYFSPIKVMPHSKMQKYVNVDYRDTMSVVGLVGPAGNETIIAEARFVKYRDRPHGDIAMVVDEAYNGHGIATHMFLMLARLARGRGLQALTADVLASNRAILRVIEKTGLAFESKMEQGSYALHIPLG